MGELRNYRVWHQAYDDPDSGLSWRLSTVRHFLADILSERSGPLSVLSLCSGDGRDIIGALAGRDDADRVTVTLVEIDGEIARAALRSAAAAGLTDVTVHTADASDPATLVPYVPADVVLLVGIFGNISDDDLYRTIAAAPQLCRPGAALIWSRGRDLTDRNDAVRAHFDAAGFIEIDYLTLDSGSRPALGWLRYDGPPVALDTDATLFTFLR